MSEQIEQSIIGMYSRGMSTRDIEDQVGEIYGAEISEGTVSTVTNKVLDMIKEWQCHSLEPPAGWTEFISTYATTARW